MSCNSVPCWRLLEVHEEFEFDYQPQAGNRRGYAVTIWVLLFGHENCGGMRSCTPEQLVMFLPHSDEHHGKYPMPYAVLGKMWHYQLCEDLPRLRPGNILRVSDMSYGALR